MAGKNGKKTEEKKDGKKIILVILAIIIVILLIVVAYLLGNQKGKDDEADDSREVAGSARLIASEEDARNVMDEMRKEVAEGMFKCDMSMNWTFEDGSAKSKDAYVANNQDNTHPIFFDVYLNDTDELIYSSPVLEVGSVWTDFALDKQLTAGTYKAKVMYTLLKDAESQEAISSAGFIITINVLN